LAGLCYPETSLTSRTFHEPALPREGYKFAMSAAGASRKNM
jgi:hypothetical protein